MVCKFINTTEKKRDRNSAALDILHTLGTHRTARKWTRVSGGMDFCHCKKTSISYSKYNPNDILLKIYTYTYWWSWGVFRHCHPTWSNRCQVGPSIYFHFQTYHHLIINHRLILKVFLLLSIAHCPIWMLICLDKTYPSISNDMFVVRM